MKVLLSHGGGGRETSELLNRLIFSRLPIDLKRTEGGIGIDRPDDGAALKMEEGYVIISIDSYTVKPLFFPGGDIGKLAACGSINDVLMMGGRPIGIVDAVVVEEGLDMSTLEKVMSSFLKVVNDENVPLIGGDLKVMPKGDVDSIIVTTACLGITKTPIVDDGIKIGDKIIVSGTIGDHGATIMALQRGIDVKETGLKSDVKALTDLMEPLLKEYGKYIHAARDPTRGGIAMALNDWSKVSGSVIVIYEDKLPIREEVKAYSDMLGVDVLQLANEGLALLAVDSAVADDVVEFMHSLGYEKANVIGEVREGRLKGFVLLKTSIGGFRIVEAPIGSIVPRIC